jgi:dihydrofolate synthase/folylpolyglutamate synthase
MMPRFPALARLDSLGLRNVRLGLEAIDAVCVRLGRPERRVPSVLVAGTNGKGSTAAVLSAIAVEAGYGAGLYTSPHLIDVTERIRVGADDIAAEELDAALGEVFAAADGSPAVPVTYFEAMTAAAFLVFAGRGLDLAVVEVGMGGRLDATNVAPAVASVVTSISLDHMEDLGPTLEAIAGEKAGVFRAGRPALVTSRVPGVLAVFAEAGARTGAELHRMADETEMRVEEAALTGTRFRLTTPERAYALATPLAGAHQAENAAAAVRAAELLAPDFRFDDGAIVRGVRAVRWPGRLEKFFVRGKTVLVDGCHNADGARALAGFIRDARLAPDLVFAALADKDIEGMSAALAPAVRRLRMVRAASPRAASPGELLRRFAEQRPDALAAPSLAAALEEFLGDPSSETIIVAGSLYLVGEARALLLSGRCEESP